MHRGGEDRGSNGKHDGPPGVRKKETVRSLFVTIHTMKLSLKGKSLIAILFVAIAAMLVGALNRTFSWHISSSYINAIVLSAPVLLLILHSSWTLGVVRAGGFLLLSAVLGLLFEIWGLTSGTFFGGRYIYNGSGFRLWSVPYIIPIYWAVFIYTAYSITNSFWVWLNRTRPTRRQSRVAALLPMIALDGLLTVLLDLILDPIKVREGAWSWLDGGSYFGIPLGNFAGWFIVTVIVAGAFRLYEYFRPRVYRKDIFLLLVPVIGYGAMGLGLGLAAILYGMYSVAVLSVLCMVIPMLINVGILIRMHSHKKVLNHGD
jgi:uncharacterized membrane protein